MDGNNQGDFRDVIATIFLFLKNNNFNESADILRQECKDRDILLNNISGEVLYECKEPIEQNISLTDRRIMLYTFLRKAEENYENCKIPNNDKGNQFKQLQEDYKSLLDVTFQLIKLLQMNLEEQSKNVHLVLTRCEFLHPTLFQPSIKQTLNMSSQTTSTLDSSQNVLEQSTTDSQEKIPDADISVPFSPLNLIQNEVKHVLENVVNDVLKLENEKIQRDVENNIQDVKILLEDIIQEILFSLVEKESCDMLPTPEKSFQVLPHNTEATINLDSEIEVVSYENFERSKEKVNLIDRDSVFKKNSNFEAREQIKKKRVTKIGVLKGKQHFPKTPLCYLETCRKNQEDCSLPCKCMKCLPEQSRYYCSCFDLIRKDIDGENIDITSFKKSQIHKKIINGLNGKQNGEDICKICDAKKCSCAFQSRPKIGRSPPT